ncbi:MAG: DEAD/DEAH box helicase [Chloroflexota bacterium]
MNKLDQFRELGLSENLLDSLREKGFEVPSPIQIQSIPKILNSQNDLVAQAQTGTGKTAAFGLPLIDMIDENVKKVQAVVLAPTRELAIQISDELNSLKGAKKLHITPIYGGQSIDKQLKKLSDGIHIVVATPGRALDHLKRRSLNIAEISFLVLDEADEMLKMGFQTEIEEILRMTNDEKRTFMFCATMPPEILKIAKKYLREFETIKIASEQLTTNLTDQIYFEVKESEKFEALCRILDYEIEFYGLIFCRTKVEVDRVTNTLMDRGYDVDCIHGDISQVMREKVLNRFRTQKVNILVATDVAARGIDIQNLTHVINYSLPQDAESYVHRVGRTGRAGAEGTAITFVTPREGRNLLYIRRASKTEIRKGKIPAIRDIINSKMEWIKSALDNLTEETIEKIFYTLAEELVKDKEPKDVIAALLKFSFKDELDATNYAPLERLAKQKEHESDYEMDEETRLVIAKGRRDGMTKKSIVELVKNIAKTHDKKINDVEVFNDYSFITVPFKEAEFILRAFQKMSRGKKAIVEKAS